MIKLNGYNKNAKHLFKKEKKRRTGFKIAFLVMAILIAIAATGAAYLRSYIRPPEIPIIGDANAGDPPTTDNIIGDDGIVSHPAEYDPEDAKINIDEIAPDGVTNADRKSDFYTFLIVGTDDGWNTDTILLASYDGIKKEASIINVPRDSLVNVRRSTKKINAAFGAGAHNGGVEGGVSQLRREIKTIIGFVPDYYVVVNLKGFEKLVDTVGGIVVDVPYRMYYNDPDQNLRIDLKKGKQQLLKGKQALQFARYRKGVDGVSPTISDYQRIENQQAILRSLFKQILKPSSITKISSYAKIFTENVYTDLDIGHLGWFVEQIKLISDEKGDDALNVYTMPTKGSSGLPDWYELLDAEGIVTLVNETINPYTVDIKTSDLDIINSIPR